MKNLKRSFVHACDPPVRPADAERLYADGNARAARGDFMGAVETYDRALELHPAHSGARFNRAYALASAGRHVEAVDAYRAVKEPREFPWIGLNLGVSLVALGRLEEAAKAFETASRAQPDSPLGWSNHGAILARLGRYEEAVELFRRALALVPNDVPTWLNLARALQKANRCEAIEAAEAAIIRAPRDADAWRTLGDAHVAFGAPKAGLEAYDRAVALRPDCLLAEASNYGLALLDQGRLDEASEHYTAILDARPGDGWAWGEYGLTQMHAGRVPEAIDALYRSLELQPGDEYVHSNLLVNLCYSPDHGGTDLRREAEGWAARHARSDREVSLVFVREESTRRLRIGYLSADFHAHPAGYLYEGLFPHHDRSRFEIVAYANQSGRDRVTDRIAASVDRWCEVKTDSDDALADRIRGDEIDVLIDLLGHTPGHRLKAFGRRLAPVQATWLGFFGTTGLPEMDFVIADGHVLPREHESHFSERPARMPGCLYAWQPPELPIDVSSLPALSGGGVTFGCFNNTAKITPDVVALWSKVLRALPTSRMILNRWPFGSARVRSRYAGLFAENGVDPARIEFRATKGRADYFQSYQDVDLMLDTFPYGGGTTTSEALWMGVPVVTLPAERFVGRMSTTILHAVGLPELLPTDAADYVRLAVDLATDLPRLNSLRETLRSRVVASPLCDLPAYARDLEATFEWMWENRADG